MSENYNSNLLKEKGLKKTANRQHVLKCLNSQNKPISAEDLFIQLKNDEIDIDLSTVYRILNIFVENDLVIKSNIACKTKAFYEINKSEHKHRLVCLGCGEILDIKGCSLIEYEKTLAKMTDFDIKKHNLEIAGYCPLCKDKKKIYNFQLLKLK